MIIKRKVAIIDPLGAHGSSFHYYTFGQCKGLLNANVQVTLYSNDKTPDPKYVGLKFFAYYKNIFTSKYKLVSGLRWIAGTMKSVLHAKLHGISVFHFHLFYTNILILFSLLLVKFLFGKVVLTIHDVESFADSKDRSFISDMIYKLTDLIFTHNQFSKEEIIRVSKFSEEDIYIVPHGNYIPFIKVQTDKIASRKLLDLPNGKTILLFFGLIKKVKGLEVLIHALKEVVRKNPDIVLLIAGKPWENNFVTYQKIITENNLQENIILHTKFISQEDVEHYYCASDLVVLPYKKIYQSGVLMMALSYERPVLVSDLPPLVEVITDNENGFLFKSEDIADLSNKLNHILNNKKKLEEERLKGNILIKTRFDWDEIGRLTKTAYQNL